MTVRPAEVSSALPAADLDVPAAAGPRWSLALPRGGSLELGGRRPLVMGVVNITPDSFSDGGRYLAADRATERALEILRQGADLVDLGAESTRPGGGVYGEGAREVPAAEEIDRLLPVLERLRGATDRPISVDTRKGEVARAALAAGADLVNDVGALADPQAAAAVAEAGCPVVLMHSRGRIDSMQRGIHFDHLLSEVAEELSAALERAVAAGVDRGQTILDPGIGFGKTAEQNLSLIRHLGEMARLGRPLLVGASRKAFIGAVTGAQVEDRLPGSLAAAGWSALAGAAVVRVHDVAETVQFLEVWRALAGAATGGEADR